MQGIQFNSIRRFRHDWYVIEWRICLPAATVRRDGVTAVNDLISLNEYGIGPYMASVLEANAIQPAPAFDRVHPASIRYFEAVVCPNLFKCFLQVRADDFMESSRIRLGWRRVGLRQRDAAAAQ